MTTKILIVDDSGTIRQQIRYILERIGYEVLEACDGREGLAIIHEMADIAMVISDLNMPFMHGVELTSEIKRTVKRKLPIVMLTTENNADCIEQARAAGACGYMIKPPKPEHLEAIVRKIAGAP